MNAAKCKHCGKYFILSENQTKCPFCKQNLVPNYRDYDLPEGFSDLFGDFNTPNSSKDKI